jgi:hypothetical protein
MAETATTKTPKRRVRKDFLMSGFCAHPHSDAAHYRCPGYNIANPDKEYQGCPCACHLGEEYECENCGGALREAPLMRPLWAIDPDDPDEMVYTHIAASDGRALGEEC